MKKLVLIGLASVLLALAPAPTFALAATTDFSLAPPIFAAEIDPDAVTPCLYNAAISADDEICVPTETDQTETLPTDEPETLSSRDLIISEIAARICPDSLATCTSNEGKVAAFIEVYNNSDRTFMLSGWKIFYATASVTNHYQIGSNTLLATVPALVAPHGYVALSGAVGNATSGYVILENEVGETVDLVGYGAAAQNATNLSPKSNQSLQRCELVDGTLDGFATYDTPSPNAGLTCAGETDTDTTGNTTPILLNNCDGLILSEIGANLATQFIEVQNISANDLDIAGCRLMTNRSTTKFFTFPQQVLPAGGFTVANIADTNLTLTKTTSGTVYLLNSDGSVEIDSASYANLKADTTFAKIDGAWRQTYAPTPGAANIAQDFPACDDGYFRNLETGKCNKIVAPASLTPCADGYFRNPETNRCKKLTTETTLAPCAEGQFRNPDTNRCKSLTAATTELTPCADGYERNPETNRCRKITNSSAPTFAVQTTDMGGGISGMWRWLAAGAIVGILLIILWQYRTDLARWFAKLKSARTSRKGSENVAI